MVYWGFFFCCCFGEFAPFFLNLKFKGILIHTNNYIGVFEIHCMCTKLLTNMGVRLLTAPFPGARTALQVMSSCITALDSGGHCHCFAAPSNERRQLRHMTRGSVLIHSPCLLTGDERNCLWQRH